MRSPIHLRVTALAVLLSYTNLALPITPQLFAEEQRPIPQPLLLEPLPRDWVGHEPLRPPENLVAPVLSPTDVTINRTVPVVTAPDPSPKFSEVPTVEELQAVRIFREELRPASDSSSPEELKALAAAVRSNWAKNDREDVSDLADFLRQYPQSAWKISLLTNIGLAQFDAGYFSNAFESWEEALRTAKRSQSSQARQAAARAYAELLDLNARVGRMGRIEDLITDMDSPELVGPLAQRVRGSRSALGVMKQQPEIAFKCGPFAIGSILQVQGKANSETMRKVHELGSTQRGTSLLQVSRLAAATGLSYQMAQRTPGAALPLPAVVHWKVGHFAAVISQPSPGRYLVKDPTFGQDLTISAAALDAEASGFFLIPSGQLAAGWSPVSDSVAGDVYGRGLLNQQTPDKLGQNQVTVNPTCGSRGMPVYNVHAMLVSLTVNDTPVGYAPPVGPAVEFQITHLQKDSSLVTNVSNVGVMWTHNWLSYVQTTSSTDAKVFLRGGGLDTYANFNSSTNKYDLEMQSRNELSKITTPATSYVVTRPDGSKDVYGLYDGTRYLLTSVVDPWNNAVTVSYDGLFRISAITDALGQVTTFTYGHPSDSRKITKVTDPFGRSAAFTYRSTDLLLESVTDVMGLTSTFAYQTSAPKYMTSMTTPYGTTSFAYDLDITPDKDNLNTSIEVTLPDNSKERTWFKAEVSPTVIPDNNASRPSSTYADQNDYLKYRNTFFWGRKAYAESMSIDGSLVESKATIYHWLHESGKVSSILESAKGPNETRVWFTYPNQSNFIYVNSGMLGAPATVVRMVDDPDTGNLVEQVTRYEYNSLGRVTKVTDPLGRETKLEYFGNGQDLQYVKQKNGSGYDVLSTFAYAGPAHLPTTVTDGAGQSTTLSYFSNGQLKTITNAKSETTVLLYEPTGNPAARTTSTTGYLVATDGPISGSADTVTIAYDALRRPRTVTDTEGYSVTTDYDNLDRPTVVTYPDGTFEQVAYPRLDAEWMRDRLGRWTQVGYNSLRRVAFVQDSMQRITSYQWCYCGALQQLTDPKGNITTWSYDYSARIQWKKYPGAASNSLTYTYDQAGRLKDVTDALNQKSNYKYYKDGALKGVTYTNAVNSTPNVSYTYDSNYPRIASRTDGASDVTNYSYNPYSQTLPTPSQVGAGQLYQVDGPLSSATDTIGYTYDELGRVLTRAINGSANTTTFHYDVAGRVDQVVNPLGTFGLGYLNATGRLQYINYPNGQRTNYSYYPSVSVAAGKGNGDQRLQQIQNLKTAGGANLSTFNYTYDTAGAVSTWTQQVDVAASQTYSFGYDVSDQLRTALLRDTSTDVSVHAYSYSYDDAGNRTSDMVDTTPRSYTINALNQVTAQSPGGPVRFSGTLTKPGTVTVAGQPAIMGTATQFSASPVLSPGTQNVSVAATDTSGNTRTQNYSVTVGNAGSRSIAYDANGNMADNGAGQTYAWDAADRLVKITYTGGATTEFAYNGVGQRVKIVEKNSGGIVTNTKQFIWCEDSQPVEERDANNIVTKRFYGGLGEQVVGANYYYCTDHLGSVREMTDSSGTIRARYDYDPYGRATKISGDLEADFGYTGLYRHQISLLGMALFRAYEPSLGLWLSRDPLAEGAGQNLYSYVSNSPLNHYDPLGLWSWKAFGRGVGKSIVGIAVGAASIGAVALLLPVFASAAVAGAIVTALVWGSAIVGAGVLGYKTGEAITGERVTYGVDGLGTRKLCDDERSELVGEAVTGFLAMGAPRAAAEYNIANYKTSGFAKWLNQGRYFRVGGSGGNHQPTLRIGPARPADQYNHVDLRVGGF